jgi:DMSO/TMAO reductase YedYZ heme-binding membrane subunit
MHPQLMWWVSRATGMVAAILLVASLVWGILLATRALKPVDRPAWLLDIHRWVSSLACIFVVAHMAALVADNYVHFSWKELFLPGGSPWKTVPVAFGVVAFWLLVAVQGTSLMMKRLPRKWWKGVHMSSYAVVWLGSVHGALAGTDARHPIYVSVAIVLTMLAVGAALVRVVVGTSRSQAAARRLQPVASSSSMKAATPSSALDEVTTSQASSTVG